MNCKLSPQFKELCLIISCILIGGIVIALLLISIFFIVGYTSLHIFDLVLILKADSPSEYYFFQGMILVCLFVIAIGLTCIIYLAIIYPLYFLIFKYKKVLNFIFDCKDNK